MRPDAGRDTIYLDHAATTPLDPSVLAVMLPYFTERFGNPSSIYGLGQEARVALDAARSTVAAVLGCQPGEVLFTGGATESDNLALRGVAWQARFDRPSGPLPHLVTTAIEHQAVLAAAADLERQGFAVTLVAPDVAGIVSAEAVAAALRPETCLVSVMYANNETGAVQPVAAIGELCRERSVPFHVDAVQAAGLLPLGLDDLRCDLLSLSAHKFYGPKGVGVLAIRRGTPIAFQQVGGGQEGGRRGGTENVPGIVGLAAALENAERLRPAYDARCRTLRDRLQAGLLAAITDVAINGPTDQERRLANNLNVAIAGVQGETMLLALDMEGIAASAGSACTTGKADPSHVLLAMGLSEERCRASLRFTVGRTNDAAQIDDTVAVLAEVVARVRQLAGVG